MDAAVPGERTLADKREVVLDAQLVDVVGNHVGVPPGIDAADEPAGQERRHDHQRRRGHERHSGEVIPTEFDRRCSRK
jgi:hypothetical protein